MHISEGVLSGPVLVSGIALAAAGTALGLKKLGDDRVARAGLLTGVFFVGSLIHIPLGASSVHLILNGLLGLLLGWAAFPSILVALTLQAVFFQFGGITTLGVNTVIMALPAAICGFLFGRFLSSRPPVAVAAAFAAGALSVLLGALLAGMALTFTERNFRQIAAILLTAYLPVMVVEGIVTAAAVAFIQRVLPVLLPRHLSRSIQ